MARAGDGDARSSMRRLTETVSLRMDAETKARLALAAKAAGHRSLSAWAIERMIDNHGDTDLGRRSRAVVSGRLGQIGARVTRLLEGCPATDDALLRAELARISAAIVALQRDLLER